MLIVVAVIIGNIKKLKKYLDVEVWHHSFFTSALDSGDWSILLPAHLFRRRDVRQREIMMTNSISGPEVSRNRIFTRFG
jgi:hypothetical protein